MILSTDEYNKYPRYMKLPVLPCHNNGNINFFKMGDLKFPNLGGMIFFLSSD